MLRSSAIHCVDSNCLQVHSTGCLFGICRLCVCVCMRVFYSVSAWIKTTFFLSSCNVRITINAPLATLSPQHSTPPLRFFFFFAAPSCGAHKIKLRRPAQTERHTPLALMSCYCHFFPKKHVSAFRSIKSFSRSVRSLQLLVLFFTFFLFCLLLKAVVHRTKVELSRVQTPTVPQCLRSWRWCKRSLATQRDFDFMTQSEPKLSLCPPLVLPRRDTWKHR